MAVLEGTKPLVRHVRWEPTDEGRQALALKEWIVTNGLGGYASGTVAGTLTRRYHGLLLTATTPPTGRMMLVNGFDAWYRRFFYTAERARGLDARQGS